MFDEFRFLFLRENQLFGFLFMFILDYLNIDLLINICPIDKLSKSDCSLMNLFT